MRIIGLGVIRLNVFFVLLCLILTSYFSGVFQYFVTKSEYKTSVID